MKKKRADVVVQIIQGDAALHEAAVEACLRQNLEPKVFLTPGNSDEEVIKALEGAVLYAALIGDRTSPKPEAILQQAVAQGVKGWVITPDDGGEVIESLRTALVNVLSPYRQSEIASLHFVGDIPHPPEEYLAHPYTLIPAGKVTGRQKQLDLLTEWITATDHKVRVLNVVAIGGMGKSAITWRWYREIAPTAMNPLAGRMWWSFYESDAHFENFVIRALAYVTNTPEGEIREITPPEREAELLEVLDREPYLIVLDGIERLMIAYARLDAARLDDESLDADTANAVAGAIGLPKDAAPTMFSPNRLRKTADPRAGAFLRKLAEVRASRILVSTRLYPADLQTLNGYPIPGSFAVFLTGLEDEDALKLWRAFGCTGDDAELLPIFHTFNNYPLLIRTLAGEVSRFPTAPGDFRAWRKAHPSFDPLKQQPDQVKAHVMSYALNGLTPPQRKTLDLIASFRMPATFDALAYLLVKHADAPEGEKAGFLFEDDAGLDAALAVLEARGLMGWDRRANRYDLHPIVRGVAWSALDDQARKGLYTRLNAHFGALPAVSLEDVKSLDELTPMIEVYNTLIGLEKYEEAFALYTERLNLPMLRRLGANLARIELLEGLFPEGIDKPPALSRDAVQARALNALALAYHGGGQPGRAAGLYLRATQLTEAQNNLKNAAVGLGNLSDALRYTGALFGAFSMANRAVLIARTGGDPLGEALTLQFVGLARQAVGKMDDAQQSFERSVRILKSLKNFQLEGVCHSHLAGLWVALGKPEQAHQEADQAWELAAHAGFEGDFVRAARAQGMAALASSEIEAAEERLTHALTRARAAHMTDQELHTLVGLAEVRRRQGDWGGAKALLNDLWESADRGPYRLYHADAYNLLAQIDLDAGQKEPAQKAALAAYYLSWCDGAPYAYQAGLTSARMALRMLQCPEPDDLIPFDKQIESGMLNLVINPKDDFGK
ncbi:MAG: hypothetical protein IT322_13800 [Anaerolineae bacterium]|nr:hypothetical protein [Anaerolineae bacterium]